MEPVTAVVVGAGNRGQNYAEYSTVCSNFKVVGVAEPQKLARERFQAQYNLASTYVFIDWSGAVECEKFADVAIIATPDQLHKDAAVAFANKGYHLLLEKPMATTAEDCKEITSACQQNKVMLSVCHVLRYSPPAQKIKELIANGILGDIVNIQLLEPVGFWHFAHSYVRGSWRNEATSSFSLLSKSCHDIDLIQYWMGGKKCMKISSFGSLMHFTEENKPDGAGSRCLDCPVESNCAYSAKKIYLNRVESGHTGWPVSVLTPGKVPDIENITEALKTGPYGRCVYDCDNDVMSNQVVNMQFEGGATSSFTMVAFTEKLCERQVTICGTKGELQCSFDSDVRHFDFLTGEKHVYKPNPTILRGVLDGHGGSDFHLMKSFVDAVQAKDQEKILSGPSETLQSHLIVFAAERSRLENRVIDLQL